MAREIERKFIVDDLGCLSQAVASHHIIQGYLSRRKEAIVRLRIIDDASARLTVKSANHGAVRGEWEYIIPVADATGMLNECGVEGLIKKTRYIIPSDEGLSWEVDVFQGRHEGLVTAEIEVPSEDASFVLPSWLGREVTGDPAYYNSNL